MQKYIETRQEQLREDRDKAHDEHDKMWYTRLIQELDWVLMMDGKKEKKNCSLRDSDARGWQWTQDMTGTGQYITGRNYNYQDGGDISHDSYYPNEYNVKVTYGENK